MGKCYLLLSTRGATVTICTDADFTAVEAADAGAGSGPVLACFPAMSNFSGRKFPCAAWVRTLRAAGHRVLLDIAAFVSTNPVELGRLQPDYAVLSFYKMFGLPTGLGALLVRHEAAGLLTRRYFGGGTVDLALVRRRLTFPRHNISHRFEDGTVDYLGIVSS